MFFLSTKLMLAYIEKNWSVYNYYLSNQHLLLIFNLLLLSGSHILQFRKSELNTWVPNLQNRKRSMNVSMCIRAFWPNNLNPNSSEEGLGLLPNPQRKMNNGHLWKTEEYQSRKEGHRPQGQKKQKADRDENTKRQNRKRKKSPYPTFNSSWFRCW